MRSSFTIGLALAAVAAATPAPVAATGSYDDCSGFISSLPAVISTPGRWCVDSNLTTGITGGHAITIAGDGVIIDCNDFRLVRGPALPSNTANAVFSNGRNAATVRNCYIQGFYRGTYLSGGTGHLVEHNQFFRNYHIGIRADGAGTRIVDNRLDDTGHSTVATEVHGIQARSSAQVVGNFIHGVLPNPTLAGTALHGITVINNASGTVIENVVAGFGDGGEPPMVRGILAVNPGYLVIRRNDVSGDDGLASVGIACDSGKPVAAANTVTRFTTGVDTCRDAGDNIVQPVLN